MRNNKLKKLIPLMFIPAMMLASCDDVMAKPKDYNDYLVTTKSGEKLSDEVYNNLNKIIYDALWESGSASTDTLNAVLVEIANSILGRYDTPTTADTVTLKSAAEKAKVALPMLPNAKDNDVEKFLDNHPSYWIKDPKTGERKTDDESAKNEYQRIVMTFERIEKAIAIKMYDKVSSGTYSKNSRFSEKQFLMSLRNSLFNVANPLKAENPTYEEVLLLPTLKKEDVFKSNSVLHLEYYSGGEYDYISKEIVPEVYKDMLTQEYIMDQSYSTLGRSYARKVNILSLSLNEKYPLLAGNLMSEFVSKYINADVDPIAGESISKAFEYVSSAWKGVPNSPDAETWAKAKELLDNSGSTLNSNVTVESSLYTGANLNYYTGTSYGDMCEKLLKIKDSKAATDTTIENDFTNSGSQSVEIGFNKKTDTIMLEDYTKDGWFIKNNGLTNLPNTIRTRLYNIGVANALDDSNYPDRFSTEGYVAAPEGEGNYVAKIHDRYYLKPANTERPTGEKLDDFLWFDKDSSTYYIVEIEEAVNSTKMNYSSDKSYEHSKSWKDHEEIARDVVECVATIDSYKTLATQYWLEYASLTYHDDKILNYFKTNYPDLFK